MNLRWLAVLSMMFCATAQSSPFPIQIIEQFDDARIVAFINESDVNNSAQWNPLKDAPPLSVASAIEAVKQHYLAHNNSLDSLSITEIEIRQVPQHKNHWHYLIKVKSNIDLEFKNTFYVVLMDGKVIPAIVEPKSYK
jgi:hypothetical protein